MNTAPSGKKRIAVIGATGHQGSAVVHALQAAGQFFVRALTRHPRTYRGLGDEVVGADLNRPDTLQPALTGTYGIFLVTNFWEQGTDEFAQGTAAVRAAKAAGVKHFVWSTLPDVEAISGGRFHVPHFTGKAKVDRVVTEAGFANHTFVVAPFFYQNLTDALAPQQQADGSMGWALPLDPRVIRELGELVAGAFALPDQAGHGEYLPLVGDFMSFNEIVGTLNQQGHKFSFHQVPRDGFAGEVANTFAYFEAHTYLGSDSADRIALANRIAGRQPTTFAAWARVNVPVDGP
jgi:uncharacterized protein YbjT (DUF2867 family)